MTGTACFPMASALSLGPVMGFGYLASNAARPEYPLGEADVSAFVAFARPLASAYAAPDLSSQIEALGKTRTVDGDARASMASVAGSLAKSGIPEDAYFSAHRKAFDSSGFAALGNRVSDLFSNGAKIPPPVAAMRSIAATMGFEPAVQYVDEVRGDIAKYYAKASIADLLVDLQTIFRNRNVMAEIFAREGIKRFRDKADAMRNLNLREDGRTVHISFDEETGMVTATHMAGYYDARPMGYYGLPVSGQINEPVVLPGGKGIAIKYEQSGSGTTTVQRFYLFNNSSGLLDDSVLRRHLVRMHEEALRAGENSVLLQRIRRDAPGHARSSCYWGNFYWAFHQYLVESGLIDATNAESSEANTSPRLTAEGLFFAPTLEAGALTVYGRVNRRADPLDLLQTYSKSGEYLADVRIIQEYRTEAGLLYPLVFTATLRPPQSGGQHRIE